MARNKNFILNISIVVLILFLIVIFSNINLFAPTGFACVTTCAFKDDFNDNSFDSAFWARTSSSTITEEGQAIKGTSTGSYQILQTVRTFTGAAEFGTLIKKSSSSSSGWVKVTITDSGADFDTGQNGGQIYFDIDGKFGALIKVGGQNTDYKFTSTSYSTDTYYWIIIKRNSDGTLTFKIEDSAHGVIAEKTTTQTISTSTAVKFNPIETARNNAAITGYVDEIYVDDYTTPVTTTAAPTTTTAAPTTSAGATTTSSSGTTTTASGATTTSSAGATTTSSSGTTTTASGGTTTTGSGATTTTAGGTTTTGATGTTSAPGQTTTTSAVTETTSAIGEKSVEQIEAETFIADAESKISLATEAKNETALGQAKNFLAEAKTLQANGEYAQAKEKAINAITYIQLAETPVSPALDMTLLLGAVVIIAILGAGAFFLMKAKKSAGSTQQKSATPSVKK